MKKWPELLPRNSLYPPIKEVLDQINEELGFDTPARGEVGTVVLI